MTLLTTPLGHLPELSLGIAAARFGVPLRPVLGLSIVAFLMGNLDVWLWPTAYIGVLVMMLAAYEWLAPWLRDRRALVWLGEISMPLFFVNGFLRGPFWSLGRSGVWYLELAGGLIFGLTSIAVAYALWVAERWIMSRIGRRRAPEPEPAT